MLSWIIQITLLSILFIFLSHNIIVYLKTTLTVPKIKDLVNAPMKKYENIYNIINKNNENGENSIHPSKLIPTKNEFSEVNMKNELKDFLKNHLHSSSEPFIGTLETNDNNQYSIY
jgi:hypothetical protein